MVGTSVSYVLYIRLDIKTVTHTYPQIYIPLYVHKLNLYMCMKQYKILSLFLIFYFIHLLNKNIIYLLFRINNTVNGTIDIKSSGNY